ncbi:MAG: ankyrin repeat domain-containing protein [Amoebophilaceae bacterium]|nr:ankyrin repeat domain-containing protein [Amoebophilaceae bacterium]
MNIHFIYIARSFLVVPQLIFLEALVSNQNIHHKRYKDRTTLSYIDEIWLKEVIPDHNKRIIGEGFSELQAINHIKPYGRTLLSYCVAYGYEDLVAKLLKYGIDPDATFNSHLTPLFYAIQKGHLKIAQQLIKAGADVNATSHGVSLLSFALSRLEEHTLDSKDQQPVVCYVTIQLLLEAHPFLDTLTLKEYIKLFKYVLNRAKKSKTIADKLLPAMGLPKRLMQEGEKNRASLLEFIQNKCAQLGQSEPANYLVQRLAYYLGIPDDQGKTCLFHAVESGHVAIVRLCMQQKAVMAIPLSTAVATGNREILALLLARATPDEINQLDHERKNPLSYAIEKNHTAIVQDLIEAGADLSRLLGGKNLTPLLYALSLGYVSIDLIGLLIPNGSALLAQDKYNHGVLWYATHHNQLEAAALMVKKLQSFDIRLPEVYEVLCLAKVKAHQGLYATLEAYALAMLAILFFLDDLQEFIAAKRLNHRIVAYLRSMVNVYLLQNMPERACSKGLFVKNKWLIYCYLIPRHIL